MIADPDPDNPEGLSVLRRFVERDVPDEWAPSRDSWLVACLIEARLAEDFWLRDDSPRGIENATCSRYILARVPREERERRDLQRRNGWKETPVERERWLRERRKRDAQDDSLALYVCELAPFATMLALSQPQSILIGTERHELELQLVEIAMAELRSAGWQIIDSPVYEKRLPADLGGRRVFDVVFATSG